MTLDTLIEGHRKRAECKNSNPITYIDRVTSLLNVCSTNISVKIQRRELIEIEEP